MDIDQYIADFLRDAQFRIAQIAEEMDGLDSIDSPRYKELEGFRLELYQYMDILYIGAWSIKDGFNHLDWTDNEIQAEAEYLRATTGMITSPFTTFVGNFPEIVASITNQTPVSGLPIGVNGDFILYDENNIPQTVKFPIIVGAVTNENITTYYA